MLKKKVDTVCGNIVRRQKADKEHICTVLQMLIERRLYSLQVFDNIKVNNGFSIKLHNFANGCFKNGLNVSRVEQRINGHGGFTFDGFAVSVP